MPAKRVLMQLEYRELNVSDLVRIGELDRSERITVGYRVVEGELHAEPVEWDVPKWRPDNSGSHTVAAQIRFCERHILAGARALGAIHEGRLVGIGLMTPSIRPGLAQLAYVHVSRAYRRLGVAANLFEELLPFASAPRSFEDTFGTYRLCLQFVADHWYMHRGQLADARRAAGLERMWL